MSPDDGAGSAGSRRWMPDAELTRRLPGPAPARDVYATHGHYLDLHLTVPRLESIAASAMATRHGPRRKRASAADYEAIIGPLYAFYAGLAQGVGDASLARGGQLSRSVWRRATSEAGPAARRASCSAA